MLYFPNSETTPIYPEGANNIAQQCVVKSTFLQSGRAGATLGGMKYAILRTQKLKATGAVWRSLKHAFREQPTPNADPDKAAKNEHVGAASAAEAMQKVRDRLPRNGARTRCWPSVPDHRQPGGHAGDGGKSAAYFNDALKWLRERHGRANVVYAGVHRDEHAPHVRLRGAPGRVHRAAECPPLAGGSRP